MNSEQLKADKDRVLTDLLFIRSEYVSDPDFALENLGTFGYNIDKKGKITIKTPGGYFKFQIEDIDRIIELVENHYPEDSEPTFTNSAVDVEDEIQTLLDNAKHNLKTARNSGNAGLIDLFTTELANAISRKMSLIYA